MVRTPPQPRPCPSCCNIQCLIAGALKGGTEHLKHPRYASPQFLVQDVGFRTVRLKPPPPC